MIPPELTPAQVAYTYANEADFLNVVLFGKTAKQWKEENSTAKGNMRDIATLNQLLVLANLESYNAVLINQGKNQRERMELLRQLAVQQLQTLEMDLVLILIKILRIFMTDFMKRINYCFIVVSMM